MKPPLVDEITQFDRDLENSIRSRLLFGDYEEPLNEAAVRALRVVQTRFQEIVALVSEQAKEEQ